MKYLLTTLIAVALNTAFSQQNDAQKRTIFEELVQDTTIHGPVKSIKLTVMDRYKKWSPGYTILVSYNEDGDWTEVKKLNEKEVVLHTRSFDKDGKVRFWTEFNEAGDTVNHITYEYGPHGIVKETMPIENGGKVYTGGFLYKYNDQGLLTEKRSLLIYNGRQSDSKLISYTYDAKGKLVKEVNKSYHAETNYVGDTLIRLTKSANTITLSHLDESGRLSGETLIKINREEESDENGNFNGEFYNVEEEYGKSNYTYNKRGHVTAIKRDHYNFPDYNDLMEYEYDDQGNIILYKEFGQHEGGGEVLETYWTREIEYYK